MLCYSSMPVLTLESPARRPASLEVIYRSDSSVTGDEDGQLRDLFFSSFSYNPIFLARRYLKQCPAHRWLVKGEGGEIVAHTAVHEKTIGTASGDLRVGGVAEVCVDSNHRGLGLVKAMLRSVDFWLQSRPIDFAMLFGDARIYASSGYLPMTNELRAANALSRHWNPFCGKPMIKCLSDRPWPAGLIDLRGPTF